jgi:hypothetical protein
MGVVNVEVVELSAVEAPYLRAGYTGRILKITNGVWDPPTWVFHGLLEVVQVSQDIAHAQWISPDCEVPFNVFELSPFGTVCQQIRDVRVRVSAKFLAG